MNRPITSTEFETVIYKFPANKSPGPDGFTGQVSQIFRVQLVGCHFLLQGIFLTQGLNQGLLYWRQIIYHLSYQGRPIPSRIIIKCSKIAVLSLWTADPYSTQHLEWISQCSPPLLSWEWHHPHTGNLPLLPEMLLRFRALAKVPGVLFPLKQR